MLRLAFSALLASTSPSLAQDALPDLSENGAFKRVEIGGFALLIEDVQRLHQAGILRYNGTTERFAIAPSITSETRFRRATDQVMLDDPRPVAEMYRFAKVPLPNGAGQTLTVPSGFGPVAVTGQPNRPTIGVSLGGVSRVPYTTQADGGLSFGLSFGNGFTGLGTSFSLSMNDLSDLGNTDRVSFGFKFSRYVVNGVSVAFGGENLFVGKTDGTASYYLAASKAFTKGVLPYNGTWTLGVGNGRFSNKTPRDQAEGRGAKGTTLFGAMSLDVSDKASVIMDWNGRNLAAGVAWRFEKPRVTVTLGVKDLTGNSGDGARLTGSVGFTLKRF